MLMVPKRLKLHRHYSGTLSAGIPTKGNIQIPSNPVYSYIPDERKGPGNYWTEHFSDNQIISGLKHVMPRVIYFSP